MNISLRSISLLLAGAFVLASSLPLLAGEPVIAKKGKGIILVYGGSARATRFYNTNGELQSYDTLQTDFVATTFGLWGNYGLTDRLQLDFDMPVGYYSITSNYRFPDRSIFAPSYIGIGATYQLLTAPFAGSVSVMGKIPPGFHRGIYDDPKHPSFLSDGYFQVTSTLNLGLVVDKTWLKGSIGYNWRDEEPLDEIIYAVEVGLSKVEGTGVFLGCNGVLSTGDASKPGRPFYAGASGAGTSGGEPTIIDGGTGRFSTIDRENYFAVSAGAYVDITDHVMLSGKYNLRLFGVNALALQGAYLGVGYRF